MSFGHRSKKKSNGKPAHAFPIPVAEITKQQPKSDLWNYYKGYLRDSSIIITCSGDAQAIYSMGYFGKGLLYKNYQNPSEKTVERKLEEQNSAREDLYLTLEEGFFLSYALGCLFVFKDGEKLDIAGQWKAFCLLKPRFPASFAVYHHFRSKGWVPKEGVKFGTDFIVYKFGPSYYHASYGVKVLIEAKNVTNESVKSTSCTWHSLIGLNRLVNSVSKELLLCHVRMDDMCTSELQSPQCLKKFEIHETAFSRWTSNKLKEAEEKDIDCQF